MNKSLFLLILGVHFFGFSSELQAEPKSTGDFVVGLCKLDQKDQKEEAYCKEKRDNEGGLITTPDECFRFLCCCLMNHDKYENTMCKWSRDMCGPTEDLILEKFPLLKLLKKLKANQITE